MSAFEDATVPVNEPKSARIGACTQPSVKKTINRAATLTGVDVSSFVMNAAYNAAQSTIEALGITVIESEADREAFFNALDNPPKPTEFLREAFIHHKTLIY